MGAMVSEVTVDADADSGLRVSWQLDGADSAVDVAFGPTPETLDHAHALTVPAGERMARLGGLGPGRHYVSVSPHDGGPAVVAAERRLPFQGALNFRDLGGYRTADGGRTRWGRVFRADALHGLTPADQAIFERLGLRVIYDLRSDLERQMKPNAVTDGKDLRSVWTPLISSSQADPGQISRELTDGEAFLLYVYRGMVANSATVLGEVLGGLADPDGLPAVFHCAAGKDRTGMIAALLLSVLGVSQDEVLDDYELTSRHRTEERREEVLNTLAMVGLSPEIAAGLLRTPRWVMETVLDEVEETYGSVEEYLSGPAGMTTATIDRLRLLLVV